jgi:membrane protein insertase Oxa1/YidC/SpoIIIJ
MANQAFENDYPGIGRLNYFLSQVVMIAAVIFVVSVFGPHSRVLEITSLVIMVASVVVDVMRLRNMGVSQWLVFVRYLPFGGTLLSIALTTAQTGWNETRQLDSAGKTILAVELIIFAMIMFLSFRAGVLIYWMLPYLTQSVIS